VEGAGFPVFDFQLARLDRSRRGGVIKQVKLWRFHDPPRWSRGSDRRIFQRDESQKRGARHRKNRRQE
jgi:hypothetical protein